ncbi:protein of unknown function [Hyphomicrobium sp. MC1]|nr:protein of unknown function [Hyphomicrobium sp. MC1]
MKHPVIDISHAPIQSFLIRVCIRNVYVGMLFLALWTHDEASAQKGANLLRTSTLGVCLRPAFCAV